MTLPSKATRRAQVRRLRRSAIARRNLFERLESRHLLAADLGFPTAQEASFGALTTNQQGAEICLAFSMQAEGEEVLAEAGASVDVSAVISNQPTGPLTDGEPLASDVAFTNAGPGLSDHTRLQVQFDAKVENTAWQRQFIPFQSDRVPTSSLDGDNGFVLQGTALGQGLGRSVAGIGDLNADGMDDFAVTTVSADEVIVVYGSASGFDPAMAEDTINGTNGIRLTNVGAAGSLFSVASAGDVNNDGVADLIVGASGSAESPGAAYVLFGSNSLSASIDVTGLDGSDGFRLDGASNGDQFGISVASGDVNGDAISDLIVGASGVGTQGAAYVVYGKSTTFSASLAVGSLNGTNGVTIAGDQAGDDFGATVRWLGDFDGDTVGDLLVTAPGAASGLGKAYVVYGDGSLATSIDIGALPALDGFEIEGLRANQRLGSDAAGIGDFNDDGRPDLLLAEAADTVGVGGARAYVVFGFDNDSGGFDLDLLDGSNGFAVTPNLGDTPSPLRTAGGGDFNGDGLADLLLTSAATSVGTDQFAGGGYVVFGQASGLPALFELTALNGSNGFKVEGAGLSELFFEATASAGDINDDGFDDVIFGAFLATVDTDAAAGSAFVVLGQGIEQSAGVGNVDETFDLRPGDQVIYTTLSTVVPGATGSTTVLATGTVDAGNTDSNLTNNEVSASTSLAPRPVVESVQINDGGVSRSQITSLTVTFSTEVTLATGSFEIENIDSSTAVANVAVDSSVVDGKTVAVLTFDSGASVVDRDGAGALSNSLADGNYRLTVVASKVDNAGFLMLEDFVFGGQLAAAPDNDDFFRLYGDATGDGVRNGLDLNAIIPTLFSAPDFRSDLDSNGDGAINGIDLNNLIPTIFGAPRA